MADPHDPTRGERGEQGRASRRARHLGRPKRDDTDDPRRSRERALKILFQADLRGVSAEEVLRTVANDDDARAILDDLDGLREAGGTVGTAGTVGTGSSVGAGGSVGAHEGADAGAPAGGGRADETEAERIWREERERAEAAAAAGVEPEPLVATGDVAADDEATGSRVPAMDGFTRSLVLGVNDHRDEVDALISRYARRWAINRMPVVDRTVLRLATYELLHEPTGAAVVINEAVELAKSLSTDDSGRYVNGVLESIRKDIVEQRRSTAPQDA